MMQASERTKIAQEVLDTHAEKLNSEFSTFKERQYLFIDVFGNDIGSSEDLAGLQNQFANGTLRPEIKFVSDEVLTDDYGNIRAAAFDSEHQTILLSEDLDAAGIESSIQQEIGHWWDVLLNGNQDTVTEDGKPFDEGTAYAERFSEGAKGDNIFSDVVYQNDFSTVLVNGQETEVEFRSIATWNIQGNTRDQRSTLQEVLNVMENPGSGIGQIEVMTLQEITQPTLGNNLRNIEGVTNFREAFPSLPQPIPSPYPPTGVRGNLFRYEFNRNNNRYLVFYNNDFAQDQGTLGTAIILREPLIAGTPPTTVEQIDARSFRNPTNPSNLRGYTRVVTPRGIYYSVHAQASRFGGSNRGNDAEPIIEEVRRRDISADPNAPATPDNPGGLPVFILGDFNRDIAGQGDPNVNFFQAFPEAYYDLNQPEPQRFFRPPNSFTRSARTENPITTLDYMFANGRLANSSGGVLNELPNAGTDDFPSDHYPVLYDDRLIGLEGGDVEIARVRSEIGASLPSGPADFATIGDNVEFTDDNQLSIDLIAARTITPEANRIRFSTAAASAPISFPRSTSFNGYVLGLENLREVQEVRVDPSRNSTGIRPEDIDIDVVGGDAIRVNLEGLTIPNGTQFDLIVTFGNSFPIN